MQYKVRDNVHKYTSTSAIKELCGLPSHTTAILCVCAMLRHSEVSFMKCYIFVCLHLFIKTDICIKVFFFFSQQDLTINFYFKYLPNIYHLEIGSLLLFNLGLLSLIWHRILKNSSSKGITPLQVEKTLSRTQPERAI